MIKDKEARHYRPQGLVSVFRAVDGKKGEFLRYETPNGVPCDEHGVELGVVEFKGRFSK